MITFTCTHDYGNETCYMIDAGKKFGLLPGVRFKSFSSSGNTNLSRLTMVKAMFYEING
jgi:hypothetical protein